MENVWTASDRTNAFVKMDGLVKTVKNKSKCVQLQLAKMMLAALIYSKTISVFVQKELMVNSAR